MKKIEFSEEEAKNLEIFLERMPCTGFTEAMALVAIGQKIKRSLHTFELKNNKNIQESMKK